MNTLDKTPEIHVSQIVSKKSLGDIETESGDLFHVVRIKTQDGARYLVAGGCCNAGMLPEYAMEVETSVDETLPWLVADLESLDAPSGALLAWHGSLVI